MFWWGRSFHETQDMGKRDKWKWGSKTSHGEWNEIMDFEKAGIWENAISPMTRRIQEKASSCAG